MADIITIKNPHRTLRANDSPDEMVQKINQNMTILWQIIDNYEDRIKQLETRNYIEALDRTDERILVKGVKSNRSIILSEGE